MDNKENLNWLNFNEFQYEKLFKGQITLEEYQKTTQQMDNKYNPKELEYWRNVFPTKTDNELEEYRVKWGKENPKYLKFKNL